MLIGRRTIRYHPLFQPLVDKVNTLLEEEAKEVQFIRSTIDTSCSVVLLGVDYEGNFYYLFPHDTSCLFIYHKSPSSYFSSSLSSLLEAGEGKNVELKDLTGTYLRRIFE